jgi:hypothetical protein
MHRWLRGLSAGAGLAAAGYAAYVGAAWSHHGRAAGRLPGEDDNLFVIRRTLLGPLTAKAERRARQQARSLTPLGV